MPTVTETIVGPDETPLQYVDVIVRVVASTSGEAAGYLSDSDESLMGVRATRTGLDGVASFDLPANSRITPANTVYEWTCKVPGRPAFSRYITVPDGAGPYVVEDRLTTAPTALADPASSAALNSHIIAADPHIGYQKESEKGQASGYASLDGSGLVPDAQLPTNLGRRAIVVRSADKSLSSAVAEDDGQLSLAVVANGIYLTEAFLIVDGSTTGDFKFIFTAPAGAALDWVGPNIATNAASSAASISVAAKILADSANVGMVGAGTKTVVRAQGRLVVAGTAGNLKIQWAQNATDAGVATTVYAGSWLSTIRIA